MIAAVAAMLCVPTADASAQLIPCGVISPCQPPDEPPQPTPTQPSVPGPFTVVADPEEVIFGEAVTIRGGLLPNDLDGERVLLYASRWPYATEQVVAATETSWIGSFQFPTQHPMLNTRYRVVVERSGQSSSTVQALAFADVRKFKVKVNQRKRRARMRFAIAFPPEFAFPIGGLGTSWYIIRRDKATQVGRSKTRAVGGTLMKARERAKLPRGNYRFRGAFCVELPVGVDVGLGEPVQDRCP